MKKFWILILLPVSVMAKSFDDRHQMIEHVLTESQYIVDKKIDINFSNKNMGMTNAQNLCEIKIDINPNENFLKNYIKAIGEENNKNKMILNFMIYHEYGHCILKDDIMLNPEKIEWFSDVFLNEGEKYIRNNFIDYFNQQQMLQMVQYFRNIKLNSSNKYLINKTPVNIYHEYFSDIFSLYLLNQLNDKRNFNDLLNDFKKYKINNQHFKNDDVINIINILFKDQKNDFFTKDIETRKKEILSQWNEPITSNNLKNIIKNIQEIIQIYLIKKNQMK